MLLCKGFAYTIDKISNDRLIIFSSAEQLQLLGSCEELLVDGTFKVCIFARFLCIIFSSELKLLGHTNYFLSIVYVMHVLYRNTVIPIIFALLPNKTQQTYQRLIKELLGLCP